MPGSPAPQIPQPQRRIRKERAHYERLGLRRGAQGGLTLAGSAGTLSGRSDKTLIARIDEAFDFLCYRIAAGGMEIVPNTAVTCFERALRLHEPGGDPFGSSSRRGEVHSALGVLGPCRWIGVDLPLSLPDLARLAGHN